MIQIRRRHFPLFADTIIIPNQRTQIILSQITRNLCQFSWIIHRKNYTPESITMYFPNLSSRIQEPHAPVVFIFKSGASRFWTSAPSEPAQLASCPLPDLRLAYHRTCLCLINSNPEYIQTCITTPFWPIKDNCRLLKCESDLEAVIFVGMWDDTCTAAVAKLISEMCQIRTNFDNTNHDSSEKN